MALLRVFTHPIIKFCVHDVDYSHTPNRIYAVADNGSEYAIRRVDLRIASSRISKRKSCVSDATIVILPLTKKVMDNAEQYIRICVRTIHRADEDAAVEALLCRNNRVFMSSNGVAFVAIAIMVW